MAAAAALACPGVVAAVPRRLGTELAEMLGRSEPGRAAEVLLEQERLEITIRLVVAYGVHIPTVAASVEAAVRQAVLKQAGFPPDLVRVRIQGVRRTTGHGAVSMPGPAAEDGPGS